MEGKLKYLIIFCVMWLILYPVVELTRIIVLYWRFYDILFRTIGLVEIVSIWIAYLLIIPILLLAFRGLK